MNSDQPDKYINEELVEEVSALEITTRESARNKIESLPRELRQTQDQSQHQITNTNNTALTDDLSDARIQEKTRIDKLVKKKQRNKNPHHSQFLDLEGIDDADYSEIESDGDDLVEPALGKMHFIRSVIEHHRKGGDSNDLEREYLSFLKSGSQESEHDSICTTSEMEE